MAKGDDVRILTVSDTVTKALLIGDRKEFGPVDLVLSCGDLPPEYLSSLRNHFDVPLLYVLGNHDLRYAESPPLGCACADKKIVAVNGLKILGLSGSRWYNGGMNQFTEEEMSRTIGRMRFSLWRDGRPDIIMTHASPRHIHDAEDPCHMGFESFVTLIERYRPGYFIHGHIHRNFGDDSERMTRIGTTSVINTYGYYFLEI